MANSNGWGDGAANNTIGWGQGANNAIGWGDSHKKSWAGLTDIVGITTDADAQAFITAAAITGATQQDAIDTLVKGMKTDGTWNKMKAIYPFATDNRNLLGYTEDFVNAYWTKQSATVSTNTTIAPNGTLTADTSSFSSSVASFVRASTIPITSGQTYTISLYVKKSASGGANNIRITTNDTLAWSTGISQKYPLTTSWERITFSGTLNSSVNVCHIVFGSTNVDGNVDNTCGGNVDIWGAQLELSSTATTYQPITTTQQAYISNQFKFNLKDPRDLDAAFRLVFNGGWTHSSTGATPNGTNAWADTRLPNNTMTQNSMTMCTYLRTDSLITKGDLGVWNLGFGSIIYSRNGLGNYRAINNSTSANVVDLPVTNSLGFFLNKRTSSTEIVLQKNSTQTTFTSNSENLLTSNFIIAKTGDFAGEYSDRQTAFVGIGDGLTNTEAANYYTRVQAFQTALSRQV